MGGHQVNQMLTRMERHPYPFACTTNAPELLDTAAARRFLFKVRFLPMTAQQVGQAHRRAFGAEASAFVRELGGLTPAGFRDRREESQRPRQEESESPCTVAGSRGAGEDASPASLAPRSPIRDVHGNRRQVISDRAESTQSGRSALNRGLWLRLCA